MNIESDNLISFYRYPPIGPEDWDYAYAASNVRAKELLMLPRSTFIDIANASSFAEAAEILNGTEYAIDPNADSARIEQMLLERRSETRKLFADLIQNDGIVAFLRAREDFANMRLAVRRVVTERPLGLEYSDEGNVPAAEFEDIFEQEDYQRFPEYLHEGVEAAVLGYYENRDIRQIDYQIDRVQAKWRIQQAKDLKSPFLLSLMRVRVDIHNIRTLLRLKMAGREEELSQFLPDGFVDIDKFKECLELDFEAIPALFHSTYYDHLLEASIPYLRSEQSFLKVEKECEDYIKEFLKTTRTITAGHQPVVAYFLMKEAEIRNVRMVLTAQKNGLSAKLIQDRLGEWME